MLITGKNSTHAVAELLRQGKAKVWYLNDYLLVLPPDHPFQPDHPEPVGGRQQQLDLGEGIHDFLERNKPHTLLLTVSDEARYKLCPEAMDWLVKAKCHIELLQFRGSWLAVIDNGIIVQELYAQEEPLTMEIALQARIGTWTSPASLRLASGGALNQVKAMLEVDGEEYADGGRGIQVAVMDSTGNVIETACFDTYMDCYTRLR